MSKNKIKPTWLGENKALWDLSKTRVHQLAKMAQAFEQEIWNSETLFNYLLFYLHYLTYANIIYIKYIYNLFHSTFGSIFLSERYFWHREPSKNTTVITLAIDILTSCNLGKPIRNILLRISLSFSLLAWLPMRQCNKGDVLHIQPSFLGKKTKRKVCTIKSK